MAGVNDGGLAFPYSALAPDATTGQLVGSMYADNRGMSLRDYFAGQALVGLLANPNTNGVNGDACISASWRAADAMLEERTK